MHRSCSGFPGWFLFAGWLTATAVAHGQVPATAGQVWQTYDIAPFVAQAGPGSERHVVDWILQETGYPAWHGATPAALSADAETLACFHTPEMQARVADVVGRFVEEAAVPHRFTVSVLGLDTPAWRTEARPALTAVPVATPGVQAWIAPRETAAAVLARLRSRSDCHALPTGPVLAANGLPATLSGGRKQPYVQDIAPRPDAWPGWQMQSAACDEGLAIDVHPLISRDGSAVEAVLRCRIDQIERMAPVSLAAPVNQQRVQVEVPQVAAVRVGERFRWPANQVLIVGLGLVPWPVPAQNVSVVSLVADDKRCDVVIVVEPRLAGGP
ncbi:MAG: hypothetical protein FJ286_13495 [Planctomycetes bacterium]|nr:hypothetical protein [Planctomycetota bacterium]